MERMSVLPLGQLCQSVSETFHSTSCEVVLINTSDVLEGLVLNHHRVENKNLKGQFKKSFKKGDILYSEIRPQNKRYAYIDFDPDGYIASTKLMVIRCDRDNIQPLYLYYFLTSPSIIDHLQALAETRSGTFPQITFTEVANLQIHVPSLECQNKIIGILKSIEDKIDVNKQLNRNLAATSPLTVRAAARPCDNRSRRSLFGDKDVAIQRRTYELRNEDTVCLAC